MGIAQRPTGITARHARDHCRECARGAAGYRVFAFALWAVVHQGVTFRDGVVEQDNFYVYLMLRIGQMPKVEGHIMPSGERLGGISEPPMPTVAPAVANVYAAATGTRLRKPPFAAAGVNV